jgi:hypothetical protein
MKVSGAYHLGQASCCDDISCVDQAVQVSRRVVDRFPQIFVHVILVFCSNHRARQPIDLNLKPLKVRTDQADP